jgi:hypothetical protein
MEKSPVVRVDGGEVIIPPSGPGWERARARVQEAKQIFNTDQVLAFLNVLDGEIRSAQFASRFSITKKVSDLYSARARNPALIGLVEAEYKRTQLFLDLHRIEGQFVSIFNDIVSLLQDFEASKLEWIEEDSQNGT